jgi:hypothetical protein
MPIVEFKDMERMPWSGGRLDQATSEKPELLKYSTTIGTPPRHVTAIVSTKHSSADNMILCGMGAMAYFGTKHRQKESKEAAKDYRTEILLEQHSIISLAAVLETFIRDLTRRQGGSGRLRHDFKAVDQALQQIGIQLKSLGPLSDRKTFEKVRDVVDYLFGLRNLIVHNGGVIDKQFSQRFGGAALPPALSLGQVIRVGHEEQQAIRDWMSLLVQEVCGVVPGHDRVWKDYVQCAGIALTNELGMAPVYDDGTVGPRQRMEEGPPPGPLTQRPPRKKTPSPRNRKRRRRGPRAGR